MIDVTTTTNQAYIDANDEWLDSSDMKGVIIDGQEWLIVAESDVVYHLASTTRGMLQRNGWVPAQRVRPKAA